MRTNRYQSGHLNQLGAQEPRRGLGLVLRSEVEAHWPVGEAPPRIPGTPPSPKPIKEQVPASAATGHLHLPRRLEAEPGTALRRPREENAIYFSTKSRDSASRGGGLRRKQQPVSAPGLRTAPSGLRFGARTLDSSSRWEVGPWRSDPASLQENQERKTGRQHRGRKPTCHSLAQLGMHSPTSTQRPPATGPVFFCKLHFVKGNDPDCLAISHVKSVLTFSETWNIVSPAHSPIIFKLSSDMSICLPVTP
ncbi:uncharacterized protein LOC128930520 [Callithrix jacchus]